MYGSCCAGPSSAPPSPSGLQLAPFTMSVVSFGASSSAQVSWSRYHAVSFYFTPLHYPVLPLLIYLSIYLSICPSVSTTYFSLYSASLRLCLRLFVLMYLNNSDHSPHTFLLLLSLYLCRSPPPPTLSLSFSLNGAMVPTVVHLWYYMAYINSVSHSSEGCLIFCTSVNKVWVSSCYLSARHC